MNPARSLAVAAAFAAAFAVSGGAHAAPRRFALLVGENTGDSDDATLKFAESDAQRLGRVLRDMGGFAGEDLIALNDVTAEEMRGAMIGMNSRIRENPNATLLVFYSGHADAEALHLRGTRFRLDELKSLVHGSPAAARVLVVDACRSGAVTRVKGGRAAPSFAVDVEDHLAAEGMAILTSSAAGEDSQESDRIGASFFTHYLVSALLGAADDDSDGKVTLDEAFRYASERTLVATAGTMSGPQHPTYRFELGGQGALVLTEPAVHRERFGALVFPAGNWLVQRGSSEGAVVAEIATAGAGRSVSLPEGKYFVTRRERDFLLEGSFPVAAGDSTRVAARSMGEVAYAQVVRKGGAMRNHTWSAFITGATRSDVLRAGGASGLEGGVRLDLRPVSFEARVGLARGGASQTRGSVAQTVDTRELSGSVAALRGFDFGRWSLGAGGALGAVQFDRLYHRALAPMSPPMMPPSTRFDLQSIGVSAGPMASAEYRLWHGLHVRVDAVWACETLEVQSPPPSGPQTHAYSQGVVHVSGGVGFFF